MTAGTDKDLRLAVARLNERAWGITVGLLLGLGLFFATIVLVVKGGPNPGPHLGLLKAYFPGYRVTFPGAILGFIYAFVLGYALGRLIGSVYNMLVKPAR